MPKFTFRCNNWTEAYRLHQRVLKLDNDADLTLLDVTPNHGEYYRLNTSVYYDKLLPLMDEPMINNPFFRIRDSIDETI